MDINEIAPVAEMDGRQGSGCTSSDAAGCTKSDAPRDMVRVRNAYKAYGPNSQVLKGLNLTVAEGSIYAFLGPSGCGKTTLLGCLAGRKRLDYGELYLGISHYGELGYMPQETALLKELTIEETVNFYGKLFGMGQEEIKKRLKHLLTFLDLPPANRQISTLSGGQQRRVSLGVTLFHDPKLLILDEPTVGVDPLLNDKIWRFLRELIKEGNRTIMLTTHYIEEARQANKLGMMREGVLLAEGAPEKVLTDFSCSKLEEVFLLLSKKQEFNTTKTNEKVPQLKESLPKHPKPPSKGKERFSLNRLIALIYKTIYYYRGNLRLFFFMLFLPIVLCILFNYTIGRDPVNLSFGVINDELLNSIDGCQPKFNCSWSLPVSCHYIEQIHKKKISIKMYDNIISAKKGVLKNEIWGFLHIPENYTKSLEMRLWLNMNAQDNIIEFSSVNVWMDESNQYIGNFLKYDLYTAYEKFLESLYEECDWPVQAARIPINYKEAIYGTHYPNFNEFAFPCAILLFSFYLPMMMVTASLLSEKRDGLLERSFVSGVTVSETFICHAVISLFILVFQVLGMMFEVYFIFGNEMIGSGFLVFLICFIVGVSGMCYGFMVSMICDRDFTATFLGLGSFFPLLTLSGLVWPREGMHYLLYSVSWALPLTITTDSFRSVTKRGWTISDPKVYSGIFVTLAWAVLFCIGTYLVAKLKKLILEIMSRKD